MRLAGHLKMTCAELDQCMPSSEYELWKARWWRDPFGDERWLWAMLVAAIVNSAPFRDKDAQPLDPKELMPKPHEESKEQPVETQKAFAEAIVAALGGNRGSS